MVAIIGGALLAVAGCATPTGPVFGDWSGRQPSGMELGSSFVELVLLGAPDAHAGRYKYRTTITSSSFSNVGTRIVSWDDRWTLTRAPVANAPTILQLHNLPADQIARYALLDDGTLLPLNRQGQPDASRFSRAFALKPLPRSSWGYGRV